MLGAARNCGRWSDVEAAKLPEILLATAMLEKILYINVFAISCYPTRLWNMRKKVMR